mmetsp:Transcript_103805/g.276209  ORF Transcript_103805/g.276209 Transcript_103805/m.276209 type:complete len:200 (-) Transcript_103805:68-667(-)
MAAVVPGGMRCPSVALAALLAALAARVGAAGSAPLGLPAAAAVALARAASASRAQGSAQRHALSARQAPPPGSTDSKSIMDKIYDMGRDLCESRPDHDSCQIFKKKAAEIADEAPPSTTTALVTAAPLPPPATTPHPEDLHDRGKERAEEQKALQRWGRVEPSAATSTEPPGADPAAPRALQRWGVIHATGGQAALSTP